MGSFRNIAFAAADADFGQIGTVWRIAVIAVLVSIFIRGLGAPIVTDRLPGRRVT
ncbi:MAG: hypothetical protein AAGE18_09395 [Pseudomonadota bacterium]